MTRRKVLISAPYMLPVIERFRPRLEGRGLELVIAPVVERLEEDDLLRCIGDIAGVICGDDRFTPRVLDAAVCLKVISKWGTGIDSIDQEACRQRGIAVRNTPNAFSEPVADSVLGYILAFARRIGGMADDMRRGGWRKIPGVSLRECTLGVIGVGNVGRAVVRRAAAFGMRVVGSDPIHPPAEFIAATGIEMVGQAELLATADFISLNCDLNPTSHHLIGERELAAMKPTAVLINTARGPIVDEPALVRALAAKGIGGAALDVFEVEPLPVDSPLRTMDNVSLAAHNSNSSPLAWERVHESTIKNLLDVLEAGDRR
ncbi:MAG: phosphoglycerate dehydrogenase [Deltaproteobacteria bacterium]|nr:phosphoglycerate dehydrogenase [Deltaproteobacteria bacterium]